MITETRIQDREALIDRCIPFLEEVKDMTASTEVERWLNQKYGPDSELYQTLARLVQKGIEDGWAANVEIDGPHYRRSRIAEPSDRTQHFSITAVYMDSTGNGQGLPRPIPWPPVRRVQHGRARHARCSPERSERLVLRRVDRALARQPALSRSQGGCRHRAFLPALGTDFVSRRAAGVSHDHEPT